MDRFSKSAFALGNESERADLCRDLAGVLSDRLKDMSEFHQGVQQLVAELRALGHDLWSFDEADDREVWCPNYQNPPGPGLLLTFTTDGVEVEYLTSEVE